jgi:hypothetical protein
MRKSRKSTQPVTKPARSLNARRTNVAAPPVSGSLRFLGVRKRDHEEEHTREQEDERRQPESCRGDDSESDVERGRDLAVRDREQRRSVEDALEAAELTSHLASQMMVTHSCGAKGKPARTAGAPVCHEIWARRKTRQGAALHPAGIGRTSFEGALPLPLE